MVCIDVPSPTASDTRPATIDKDDVPQFRACITDPGDPTAEDVAWSYNAPTYHDGYNVALRRCPEGWQVVSVTTVPREDD